MAEMSQESTDSFTQAKNDEVAVYEVGFHVVPTVSESEVGAVVERIRTFLEKAGASIIVEEFPKKMTFAYRIERSAQGKREKYTEGYFGWIKFEGKPEMVKPLEAALRDDNEVLRSLIIHTTRESVVVAPRAVFTSDRLEGQTIEKPAIVEEKAGVVSEEELDKSLDAIVSE